MDECIDGLHRLPTNLVMVCINWCKFVLASLRYWYIDHISSKFWLKFPCFYMEVFVLSPPARKPCCFYFMEKAKNLMLRHVEIIWMVSVLANQHC